MNTIQDQEDREFTTSLGHWTGQMQWAQDYIVPHMGVAQATFNPGEETKQITLTGPNIRIPRSALIQTLIQILKETNTPTVTATASITDGTHTITRPLTITNPDYQGILQFDSTTPPDWAPNNTTLTIELKVPQSQNIQTSAIANIVMTHDTHTEYLPIIGIG